MMANTRWLGQAAGAAMLATGLLTAGCDARSGGDAKANATANLSSLPAAEAWIDGKSAGSTPLAVSVTPGRHELVLKQTGFTEQRSTFDVAAGTVATVDATLQPIDPMDPDALRQVAASYGVTVEPFRAPEVHRGAASIGGVSLLYPRNDVRKEGLSGYRVDVTPAYEGGGWLEFRKGKTSLSRQKFDPDTLVNSATLPKAVTDALKVGDTVTWGVYFTDSRKPVTAQFEIVAKPAAAKKLAEIATDKRLALQPSVLRQQLEAEILQNHRLYSEALVHLLDIRAADKDNMTPYTGIVSCLRRLDLEDTALFTEAASKAIGTTKRNNRTGDVASTAPSKLHPVGSPASPAPATAPSASAPAAPPVTTPPPAPDDAPVAGPTSPSPTPSLTPPSSTAPGALPTSPSATAPSAGLLPVAPGSPTPGSDLAPTDPSHPSATPTHPADPVAPAHPTAPAPTHPDSPLPHQPGDGAPVLPPGEQGPAAPTPTPTPVPTTDPVPTPTPSTPEPSRPEPVQPTPEPTPTPVK